MSSCMKLLLLNVHLLKYKFYDLVLYSVEHLLIHIALCDVLRNVKFYQVSLRQFTPVG